MSNVKIFVAGHKGMVGSSIVRKLKKKAGIKIITRDKKKLNLINQEEVNKFFKNEKIDQVYLAAAKVGGIYANTTFPAEFIYQNLIIQANVIHGAFSAGVKKLLFLGSSCIYPKNIKQPMKEEDLLSGKLEATNEPYAIAKISGIKLCESYNRQFGKSHGLDYRCVMPTNLYGPGDNYHPDYSHVVPGLINRFHLAKINNKKNVLVWGTGKAKRELLYVDDMADAAIFVMNLNKKTYQNMIFPNGFVNIGSKDEISIKNLAKKIKNIVGFKGKIKFDLTKPDGTIRKLIDSRRIINLGWRPKVTLSSGLKKAYKNFLEIK